MTVTGPDIHGTGSAPRPAPRARVGVFGIAGVSVWSARGWMQLRRLVVRRYENGLSFADASGQHEIGWEEITGVVAQYVPGVRKRGIADEGNLVAVVLTFARGRVSLPKELEGFRTVVAELKQRIREVKPGPDGFLYALTDETFGAVLRIEPGK